MKLPKGYGSVYKLPGRRRRPWIARITTGYDPLTGKQQRVAIGYYATKKEAVEALGKNASRPGSYDRYRLTFKDVFDMVYAEKEKTVSENRLTSYRYSYDKYLHVLGSKNFASLMPQDYQKFFDALPLSGNSKSLIRANVTAMYTYAIANNIVDRNYCVVNLGDTSPTHRKKRFTDEEITALWSHEGEIWADMALFGIYTGFRPTAITIIENANVHLDEEYIIGGIKTKAGRNRTVPINKKIVPLIKRYYNSNRKYLFTYKNSSISTGQYGGHFVRLMKTMGMTHSPHDTRVTCNTLMAKAGVPDVPRKLIMGHAQKDINDAVYTDVLFEELKEAINRI